MLKPTRMIRLIFLWMMKKKSVGPMRIDPLDPEAQIAPVAAQQVARVLQKHGERLGAPAGLDVIRKVSRHPPGQKNHLAGGKCLEVSCDFHIHNFTCTIELWNCNCKYVCT